MWGVPACALQVPAAPVASFTPSSESPLAPWPYPMSFLSSRWAPPSPHLLIFVLPPNRTKKPTEDIKESNVSFLINEKKVGDEK